MIIGAGICGHDVCSDGNFRFLNDQKYGDIISKIKFYSQGSGVIIDKVWGQNIPIDYDYIYNLFEYNPTWNNDTYMLAEFNYSNGGDIFSAGQITYSKGKYLSFTLHKIEHTPYGDRDIVVKDNIPLNSLFVNDYLNVYGGEYYITVNGLGYYVDQGETKEFKWSAKTLKTPYLNTKPIGYFLIDVEKDKTYYLQSNIGGGSQRLNMSVSSYDLNNKFDSIYKSVTNFESGQISGIIYEDNKYSQEGNTLKIINEFREFVYSNRKKILKTGRGNCYNVIIKEYSETILNNTLSNSPLISNISWEEVV